VSELLAGMDAMDQRAWRLLYELRLEQIVHSHGGRIGELANWRIGEFSPRIWHDWVKLERVTDSSFGSLNMCSIK